MKFCFVIICALLFSFISANEYHEINESSVVTVNLQRPRQFLMDIYSRPNRKGIVQHMRLDQGGRPCWNLASKYVGSITVNDPFVKITFYRSLDCNGVAITSIQGSETVPNKKHSLLKARSVSMTRIKPVVAMGSDRIHFDTL